MKKLTLEEIKAVEFNILVEFQKLCNEHDLKFYLCGGSLLGAIRHKGFIPWDDDIDICMARPEYMRLAGLVRDEKLNMPEWMRIVCFENGTSRFPFIKVLDKRYVVHNDFFKDSENDNLWIDLLPVDGIPEKEEESKQLFDTVTKYRKYVQMKYVRPFEGKSLGKKLVKPVLSVIAHIINTDRYNYKIVDMARKNVYEKSDWVGIVTEGLYGTKEAIPRDAYEKSIEVEFEGHKFLATSYWHEYLTNLFGDYMCLPPEDKRKTHDMKAYQR
ncbi:MULTISPECIES: phosphorylcholine transferase LicD [unclassified Butyrivibrio]|uniref:LicD family protein n=1 Tax=unclassified Butyrivibrio TaxID=2639466 RepID=UPI0003B2F089|nr:MULTISPECIES: LicD family protein [unclassified Butyrivibrio]SDB47726.1 lipopolysaccharide cholinephosphotransferase [Butyrivibrio sp. INlla16]